MTSFTAVKDFFSEELQSQYVAGQSYTARPNNTKLLELLPTWAKEGKIILGRPAAARVSGSDRPKFPLSSGGE